MNGDYRIYQPLGDRVYEAWENAEEINSSNSGNTNDISKVTDESDSPNLNPETTETAGNKQSNTSKRLMKYFGTDNKTSITIAGEEGYLGSNKPKDVTGKLH